MINCILAGVGGQGTVLASKLLGLAAMKKGLQVRTAETIGMAQRGGGVVSHVRMGEEVHSPLIPLQRADLIIGFEPGEAVRCLPYLKEEGTVIVSNKAIKPVTDSLAKTDYDGEEMLSYLKSHVRQVIVVDGDQIIADCGSPKVLNIALLGAAAGAGALGLTLQELEGAVKESLHPRFLPMNMKALQAGADSVAKENGQ